MIKIISDEAKKIYNSWNEMLREQDKEYVKELKLKIGKYFPLLKD